MHVTHASLITKEHTVHTACVLITHYYTTPTLTPPLPPPPPRTLHHYSSVSSHASLVSPMIAICEHYKWKRLALITETNDVMRSISEVMRTDMAEGGIANVADLTVPMNVITDIKAADAIFKQLELSDARIIVMLAYVSLLHLPHPLRCRVLHTRH